MIILNFSHPLTAEQQVQITAATGEAIERIVRVVTHFDDQAAFGPQAAALCAGIDLAPEEWQRGDLLVVLPSLNYIAALLLAEIHGRAGGFPAVVRLRPVANSPFDRYEFAEVLNLQEVRRGVRRERY